MSLTASENWDGVTPPAIPSGWYVDSALVTSSSQSYSASNSLNQSTGSSGTRYWGCYATGDGSGTDPVVIAASVWVKLTNTGITTDYEAGLVWRGSADTLNNTSTSQYIAHLSSNLAAETYKVVFAKQVSGSYGSLASVTTTDFGTGDWYQVLVDFTRLGGANSTSIAVRRSSDSYYLASGGTWQSGATYAISANADNSLSTGAYGGVYARGATTGRIWLDDWSLVSGPPAAYALWRPNPVPRPTNAPFWT